MSCERSNKNQFNDIFRFNSFRDVPDITEDEIRAIEALQGEFEYFIYGMPLSVEAFINETGEVRGYASLGGVRGGVNF